MSATIRTKVRNAYDNIYAQWARACARYNLHRKLPFINVYDDSEHEYLGGKFIVKGHTFSNTKPPPDFRIHGSFQDNLLDKFNDESTGVEWRHAYGVLELENAVFALTYPIHRVRNGVFRMAFGGEDWCLCQPRYLMSFLSTLMPAKRRLDEAVMLLMPFYDNYYHWTVETLPRISLIMDDKRLGHVPIVLSSKRCPSFIRESIKLAGLSERVLYLDEGTYTADKLYVPTLYAPRSELCHEVVSWLNEHIHGTDCGNAVNGVQPLERIYISRDDATTRRVLNISDVDIVLARHSITKIKMTDYSLREQAQIFRRARLIVGLHGAALANLAYASPGATLIELFMEGLFTKAFFNLARFRGMQYGCLLCKQQGGNLIVDPRHLADLISRALD